MLHIILHDRRYPDDRHRTITGERVQTVPSLGGCLVWSAGVDEPDYYGPEYSLEITSAD